MPASFRSSGSFGIAGAASGFLSGSSPEPVPSGISAGTMSSSSLELYGLFAVRSPLRMQTGTRVPAALAGSVKW